MSDRHYRYTDQDLTFYLQVYRDYPDARACLAGLRRYFETARVIMISDGDPDRRYNDLAQRFGVEYTPGTRLYTAENGGKMIHRMLGAFLQKPSDYLIKIDTDTRIHRRFRYLPLGSVVFGTLEWQTVRFKKRLDFPNVQGGFVGFGRGAAEKMYASDILLSEKLLDYRRSYADTLDIVKRVEYQGLISMDHIIRYVCRTLNVPVISFDEVYSIWRGKIAPDGEGYAATHPHKVGRRFSHWRDFLRGLFRS